MNPRDLVARSGFALSPDAPGGAPAGAPGVGSGTINPPAPNAPADVVPVSKAEYAEYVAAKQRLGSLEKDYNELKDTWGNAELLLRQDSTVAPEKVQEATRKVLAKAGWTQAQIDAHLAGTQEPQPKAPKGKAPPREDKEEDEPSELEVMRQELGTIKQQQGKTEVQRLNQLMQAQVGGAVDTTKELATVMATLVKANAPEDSEKAKAYEGNLRSTVVAEVNRELLDRLRTRRAQNGNRWDDTWVADEAANAAKAVAAKYRAFVPDPSRIGRSEETGAADDFLTNTQPVAAPEYKKGKTTMSDAQSQLREWAADQLIRGASGAAT